MNSLYEVEKNTFYPSLSRTMIVLLVVLMFLMATVAYGLKLTVL